MWFHLWKPRFYCFCWFSQIVSKAVLLFDHPPYQTQQSHLQMGSRLIQSQIGGHSVGEWSIRKQTLFLQWCKGEGEKNLFHHSSYYFLDTVYQMAGHQTKCPSRLSVIKRYIDAKYKWTSGSLDYWLLSILIFNPDLQLLQNQGIRSLFQSWSSGRR